MAATTNTTADTTATVKISSSNGTLMTISSSMPRIRPPNDGLR